MKFTRQEIEEIYLAMQERISKQYAAWRKADPKDESLTEYYEKCLNRCERVLKELDKPLT